MRSRRSNSTGKAGKAAAWLLGVSLLLPMCVDFHETPTGAWVVGSGNVEDGLYGAGSTTQVLGGRLEIAGGNNRQTIVLRSTYATGIVRTDTLTRSGEASFPDTGGCDSSGPDQSSLLLFDKAANTFDTADVRGDTIVQATTLQNGVYVKIARIVWIRG